MRRAREEVWGSSALPNALRASREPCRSARSAARAPRSRSSSQSPAVGRRRGSTPRIFPSCSRHIAGASISRAVARSSGGCHCIAILPLVLKAQAPMDLVPDDLLALLDSTPDPTVVVDGSGTMVLVSRQTEVLFG